MMSKYTVHYTMQHRYEAVVYANSPKEAYDHVHEQCGSHKFLHLDLEIDDCEVEAIECVIT